MKCLQNLNRDVPIARGRSVEDSLGPVTDSCDYEPFRRSSFAPDSLAKMQIREGSQKYPSYRKSNKTWGFDEPFKIQALHIEPKPDMYQKEADVTGPNDGHTQLESKSEKPAWLQKRSQTDALRIPMPGQLPKPTVSRSDCPNPDDESDGHEICQNLCRTEGWEPDRSQHLEGKHYSWAAVKASDSWHRGNQYPRGEGNRNPGTNYGDDRTRRPDPIPPEIPMYTAGAPSQFHGLQPRTLTPSFRPLPGDIVITLECRPIRHNNPYFAPGGHCYFYTDPVWVDGARQMTRRAQAEDLSEPRTRFDPDDLIIRTGQMDNNLHWIPQRNVEVFRHVGSNSQGPGSWLLYNSAPNHPIRPPITYAAGDPALAHRTVHEFLPANAWADRVIFTPERGDIILCEQLGFRNMGVWFYEPRDRSTTQIECPVVLVRAGYGRVGDSLVATVEMYQKKPNPATGELGWVFQGRDIQIFGGTITLDSLIQMMDLPAGSAPRDRSTPEEAEADSYLNFCMYN